MLKLRFLTAFLVLFLLSDKIIAETYTSAEERVEAFSSHISVNKDGTLNIIEDIYYDFGPNQRHGIYRDIPFVKTNTEGKKFKLNIKDIEVAGDKAVVSTENEKIRIKIGDPDKLISGKKRYQISYKVYGALTYFSDHDELYWNLSGNSWQVPIGQFTGEVIFPFDLKYTDLKLGCFSGVAGSTKSDCEVFVKNADNNTFVKVTANNDLGIEEGVTAVIGFPKGLIETLEPESYFDPTWIVIFVIGILLLLSLYVQVVIIYRWAINRRNVLKKQRIVAAWFQAPSFKNRRDFSPAETVGLVNRKTNHKTLTASIIYLAQKGFLKIIVDDKKVITFVKKNDWENSDISAQDKYLLSAIFSSGETVTDKELKKSNSFAKAAIKVSNDTMENLYKEKLFIDNPTNYIQIMTVLLICSSVFIFIVFPIGIPLIIFSWFILGKSVRFTDLGIEKYSEAKSLHNFLVSQTDQLDFQAKNQMFFEKLLPYATAFGVEKVWAKRFEGITFTQSDWYDGPNTNSMLLVGNLNSLNRTFRAVTATNSSSGFSSGFSGGHSAGGGGGGGGGSW